MKKILLLSAMVMGMALTSCESDGDAPITYNNVTVNVGDTYTIPNSEGCDWKTGNPVVATVEGDLVTTHYVGTCKIWCANGNFVVTIDPITTLYLDPICQWGATDKNIKDQLTAAAGYTVKTETKNDKEQTTSLLYNPNSETANQMNASCEYKFEVVLNEKGKEVTALYEVVETIKPSVTEATVLAALSERYPKVSENHYISTDKSMDITLDNNGSSYTVTYTPAE